MTHSPDSLQPKYDALEQAINEAEEVLLSLRVHRQVWVRCEQAVDGKPGYLGLTRYGTRWRLCYTYEKDGMPSVEAKPLVEWAVGIRITGTKLLDELYKVCLQALQEIEPSITEAVSNVKAFCNRVKAKHEGKV